MRTHRWLPVSLLVLTVGACSSGSRNQGESSDAFSPLALEPPPVYALLGYRSDLDLTSSQIAALDSIAGSAREVSAPLLRELEERIGEQPRRGMMRVDPEDEPLIAEIRESQLNVSEAVAEVLTEEQRGIVCRLYERTGPPGGEGAQRPSPSVAEGGNDRRGDGIIVWHWCRATTEDSSM